MSIDGARRNEITRRAVEGDLAFRDIRGGKRTAGKGWCAVSSSAVGAEPRRRVIAALRFAALRCGSVAG
jgi:hypothetical protein